VTWEELVRMGQELPGVSEDVWYGTPSLKVRGKGFVRLKEDGRSVVFMLESVEQQELLIAARPKVYYITDHYRGWPAVLARLPALSTSEARRRLEHSWQVKAPPAVRKAAPPVPVSSPRGSARPTDRRPGSSAGPIRRRPRRSS
jgi:hypothetical protein